MTRIELNRVATRSKALARHFADRVMLPYVDTIVGAVSSAPSESTAPPDVPSSFFHGLLHELRTVELDRLRGSYERIVSVGASGGWYFDWFERSVGPVIEHVGVEAFEPEPDDLPSYVTWVATTADRFDGLDDDGIDLVFAGQTSEHLWADELAGFLLQARRVLRDTGVLVLDSPNRLVTEHLHWSHGGHTVELSPAEIRELVELAGFEVESIRGVWRCRFGEVLGLEERLDDGPTVVRRIVDGADRPDDCFVWWLVARPSTAADPEQLRLRVEELFAEHWATRVCRGMWPGPSSPGVQIGAGACVRLRSLPFMLRPGRFRFGLKLLDGDVSNVAVARFRLELPGGHVVREVDLRGGELDGSVIWWEIDQTDLMFAVSIELEVTAGKVPIHVAMPMIIDPAAG